MTCVATPIVIPLELLFLLAASGGMRVCSTCSQLITVASKSTKDATEEKKEGWVIPVAIILLPYLGQSSPAYQCASIRRGN